jgi:hypothetical protein
MLNLIVIEVIREELQNLLDVVFITPIFDNRWVLLLVVVLKKEKVECRVCTKYRKLNKATSKDHFPSPFINPVFDNLLVKSTFCFLKI